MAVVLCEYSNSSSMSLSVANRISKDKTTSRTVVLSVGAIATDVAY